MFWRRRSSNDFAEEIKSHLELEAEELRREGFSEDEARRRARVEFGSVQAARERFSVRNRAVWLENFVRDARFAVRQLLKNPGFSVTAIVVLALGIGATTAIFAFVDAALIKPLPYAAPARLVRITEREAAIPLVNISYLDYLDWNRLNTVLSSMDVFSGQNLLLRTPTGTEPVPAVQVSSGFFRTLGVNPALGRDFYPSEQVPGGPKVVMLSYGAWERRFGRREDVIGTPVMLNGASYSVIGVLPRGFEFALAQSADFWTALQPVSDCEKHRDCHNLYGVGRLKDGVSVQTALANMQSIAQQLERQYPDTNHGRGASVMPLSEAIIGEIRPILLILLAGAGLLLLIACVNVSSLLMVHAERRKREIAVREALGASRSRIAAQLITEVMVLVIAGGLGGLLFAGGAMQVLTLLIAKQAVMTRMPYLLGARLSTHELELAGLLLLLAGIFFSVTPIVHVLTSEVREALTEGGRAASGRFWRHMGKRLVVIELATTVVLLSAAGLLGKSLYRLLHVDVGFQTDHLATLMVRLPQSTFATDAQQVAFGRSLIDRVEHLPGVRSAAATSMLPATCTCNSDWLRIVGRPYNGEHITANERHVSSDFFTTIHATLQAGRYFTDAEDASKPKVVLINRTFAREYFPGEDAVGKILGDPALSPSSLKQIVGVVDDFKDGALDEQQLPSEYIPFNQNPTSEFNLVVRTAQDERSILPLLAATVHELNKDVGVEDGSTMSEVINDSPTANLHRTTAYLVGGFAALALLLSAVGLYGVIAYSVSQRTREIGVRMALGAHRSSVHRMVLGDASRLAAIGIVCGMVSSLAAARLLRGLLFGVRAWDISTFAAVITVLGSAALLASYVPARRAASVNPVDALRTD
jgi:macrolide transport system ATP-binding/permease protein